MSTRPILFRAGTSILHRLHPLTKLTFSLMAILVIFGGAGGWISAFVTGLLAMLILWRAGLAAQSAKVIFRLLGSLTFILFIIHGFFFPENKTILFHVANFSLGAEGLQFAFLIVMRLTAALAASLVMILTTPPSHLMQAMVEARLPYGLAYLLGSPLFLLPQMLARAQAIQAAQQSRGLETQGSLSTRVRALFPLVAPLVFSALIDVEERSLALEARGFNAPYIKSSLMELPDTKAQRILRAVMILFAATLLLARIGW